MGTLEREDGEEGVGRGPVSSRQIAAEKTSEESRSPPQWVRCTPCVWICMRVSAWIRENGGGGVGGSGRQEGRRGRTHTSETRSESSYNDAL